VFDAELNSTSTGDSFNGDHLAKKKSLAGQTGILTLSCWFVTLTFSYGPRAGVLIGELDAEFNSTSNGDSFTGVI
jgi:hypothetical protein